MTTSELDHLAERIRATAEADGWSVDVVQPGPLGNEDPGRYILGLEKEGLPVSLTLGYTE